MLCVSIVEIIILSTFWINLLYSELHDEERFFERLISKEMILNNLKLRSFSITEQDFDMWTFY